MIFVWRTSHTQEQVVTTVKRLRTVSDMFYYVLCTDVKNVTSRASAGESNLHRHGNINKQHKHNESMWNLWVKIKSAVTFSLKCAEPEFGLLVCRTFLKHFTLLLSHTRTPQLVWPAGATQSSVTPGSRSGTTNPTIGARVLYLQNHSVQISAMWIQRGVQMSSSCCGTSSHSQARWDE